MSEPEPEYIATIDDLYVFVEQLPELPLWLKDFGEQQRRAHITAIRAWDKVLGRRQTIPRKER